MATRSVYILVTLRAKAKQEKRLQKELRKVIRPSRREPGCVCYTVRRRRDDPRTFFVVEEWRSAADHERHLGTPHITGFLGRKREFLDFIDIAQVDELDVK